MDGSPHCMSATCWVKKNGRPNNERVIKGQGIMWRTKGYIQTALKLHNLLHFVLPAKNCQASKGLNTARPGRTGTETGRASPVQSSVLEEAMRNQ